ncbi:MAG: hypothetical protein AB7I18_03070 [Candidatus Berkiella sp.]
MLSFLSEDACRQLAEGAIRNTCEWAVSNPMVAMGIAAGTAAIAATTGGLYWLRSGPQRQVATRPIVARLQRESIQQTIASAPAPVVAPVTPAAEVAGKMPVQTIVLEHLRQQKENADTREVALRLWDLRKNEKQRLDPATLVKLNLPVNVQTLAVTVDQLVLAKLGLPPTGKMPTGEGQAKYEQVLDNLNLSHLNKFR